MQEITIASAVSFLLNGIRTALSPQCRYFVIIPVLLNFLLLAGFGYILFGYLSDFLSDFTNSFPEYLKFIAVILKVILIVLILFTSCYFFSTIATIIASPFYGLLADRVENLLNGTHGDDMTITELIKDIPRIFKRELKKQLFFLPLAFLCLILFFIPVINLFAPILWFLLSSWMGSIQYVDYAYDNHKIPFFKMNSDLKAHFFPSLIFGGSIAVLLTVPVLNLIIPPAAVCAGTEYYISLQKSRMLK
ncbi:MAG: sulfate transporter CysZ [Succinivibrio sp.]